MLDAAKEARQRWQCDRLESEAKPARPASCPKVVNTRRSDREPYRRFVREIEFLRSLDDLSGVLPVIDAYLPAKPSRNDRTWLGMPMSLSPTALALARARGRDPKSVAAAVALPPAAPQTLAA